MQDRFLFQGEIVHQGPPQEESLAFQLFREGIQWLEFRNGFTAEELNVFFKLLNRYRIAKEEAEGDLVTALWEADFPHLQYKNEDVLWEAEPLIDFSLLKVAPGEVRPEEEGVEESVAPAAKIAMPAADAPFWKLTPAEEKEIQAMILEEETRDCKDPTNVLFELTRHAQDSVCKDAINALVDRDPQNLRKLFPLLEDPRPPIRHLICGHLGKRGNPLAEELLLDYLEHNRFQLKDRQHILACYRALGQCGSPRSLPFLKESLLKQDWKAFLGIGGSLHRQGAALALLAMRNEEAARSTLQKASRNIFSGVRLAYRRAVEEDQNMKKEPSR